MNPIPRSYESPKQNVPTPPSNKLSLGTPLGCRHWKPLDKLKQGVTARRWGNYHIELDNTQVKPEGQDPS